MNPPRTLKQRLAMLTSHSDEAESSSSAQVNRPYVPRVNIPKRRQFNPVPPPIPPKRTLGSNGDVSHREDKVQEVMTRFIFQAGVDYELVHRIMLCLCIVIYAQQDTANVRCTAIVIRSQSGE